MARRLECSERIEINLNDEAVVTLDGAARELFFRRYSEMFPRDPETRAANSLRRRACPEEGEDAHRFQLSELFAYFGSSVSPIATSDPSGIPFGTRITVIRR